MCWNKNISFLTLLIGTVFTILLWTSYTDPYVRVIACIWQFVLCMQLFEGLSWISKEEHNTGLSEFSTKGAFLFNILQPIVVALLCILVSDSSLVKYTLSALLVIYLTFVLSSPQSLDAPLYENDTCRHLQLYWWSHFSSWVFIFYMIIIIVSCLSLKPLRLGIVQLSYIIITLILSSWLYPCTYGSIWCWFAAFAPLGTFLYLKTYGLN